MTAIGNAIGWVLAGFYSLIPNYGVAIILLSVAWMLLLAPLTLKQTRSMLAMQRLQPKLKQLQEQHRHDKAALSQATMDLYKAEGVNPLGGCLPAILPLPIFFVLFRVIDGLKSVPPKYLNSGTRLYTDVLHSHGHLNAFGMDLGRTTLDTKDLTFGGLFPYLLMLLLMIGAQYYQQVQLMSRNPMARNNPQMRMMRFLPVAIGVFSIRFPAGVVLYYFVSSLCRITQQWLMYRFDPKVKALVAQDLGFIEAEASELEKPKERQSFRDRLASALPAAPSEGGEPKSGKPSGGSSGSNRGGSGKGGKGSSKSYTPPRAVKPPSNGERNRGPKSNRSSTSNSRNRSNRKRRGQ